MLRRQRHRLAIAMAILALVASACSGDDDLASEGPLTSTGPGPEAPPGADTVAGSETSTTSPIPDETPVTSTTGASQTPVTGGDAAATTTTTDGATTVPPSTTTPAPTTTYPPSTRPAGAFVRIGDDYFTFDADECYIYDGIDAVVSGVGEAPDGTPVFISLLIDTLRVDIGTGEPFVELEEHWAAGTGSGDDMVVTMDNWTVRAEATFVYGPTQRHVPGEFEVECEG